MRIFIKERGSTPLELEVESFYSIDDVKGLIKKRLGYPRSDQKLAFGNRILDDLNSLEDYNIQNNSTIFLSRGFSSGMDVRINMFPGKTFTIFLPLKPCSIRYVKDRIREKMGIPVTQQRLIFSGKELHHGHGSHQDYGIGDESIIRLVIRDAGEDVVDIAAVQARRKKQAALTSKPKRIEDQVEVCLSSRGANSVEGVESFWDEEDSGLAWRRSQSLISSYDLSRFESKSRRTLIESVANDCVRTLNVAAFIDGQLQEYEDKMSRAEEEVKRLTNENACVMDEMKRLMQVLVEERSTGVSFLQSEAGQHHIVTLKRQAAESGVDEFKKSDAFKEIVMNRCMSVYDDVVNECQRLLRESGRVSEDIIQLIDGVDGVKMADSKKLMQELDVERSTGVSFLQSEVGREHIVCLKKQAAESGVEEFKKSDVFEEIVMSRAMSVYDDVVKECKRLLRESGCVSEDIIQLLDHA